MRTPAELREWLGRHVGAATASQRVHEEYQGFVARLAGILPASQQASFRAFASAVGEISRSDLDELLAATGEGSVDPDPTFYQTVPVCSACGHHSVYHVPIHESSGPTSGPVVELAASDNYRCLVPNCGCEQRAGLK